MSRRDPLTPAEREKRRRQRIRDGEIVLRVTVHQGRFGGALIDKGLLAEDETRRRARLEDMARALLDHWARGVLENIP